jgi:hypothetical protein
MPNEIALAVGAIAAYRVSSEELTTYSRGQLEAFGQGVNPQMIAGLIVLADAMTENLATMMGKSPDQVLQDISLSAAKYFGPQCS